MHFSQAIVFKSKRFNPLAFVVLFLLGITLFSLLSLPLFASSSKTTVNFVSPDWVASHSADSDLRVLDVRNNPLEYIAGHVPNAVHVADIAFRGPDGFLPVQYWNNKKLGEIFSEAGVAINSKVLVYSAGNDVLGATMVAYLLERSGVKEAYVLDGGFAGYKAAGKNVTKEFPRYQKTGFSVRDRRDIRVTLDEVRQLLGKPGVVFIDPRPADLFRGDRDLWVRNGHIPGARNIPWPTFTEANNAQEALKNPHKLRPLDELRQLLAERGITPASDIIVSCSTGREATLQYVVLKHLLGYPKVRIYEGSWTEYSTTDLPVETGPEKVASAI
ncbi:MAG TPA: sulfurtransferase [Cyanobacteria bacterium UBA8156]|nr:sulfurtransferase [Cyanobacteria bacterium UBA8156]